MKYWLLTTEYPPAHGGGISTYCRCTAEMLSDRGIDVTVVVSDEQVQDHALEFLGKHLAVARFNPARRAVPVELGGTAGLSFAFYKMVELLIREIGMPDLIESQDYLGIAYYLQQFKLLGYPPYGEIPVVITIHAPAFVYLPYNDVPMYHFPDFWTGVIEKESIRAADLVMSPSAFMAEEVGKHLDYRGRPPVIVPYGYRACTAGAAGGRFGGFANATGSMAIDTPAVGLAPVPILRNKIVYYGKLSPQKGSFELLKYFSELWNGGFSHPLHIVGGTDIVYHPTQQTMGQFVRQRYREYIARGLLYLHGKIDPSRISEALADAHVVLLPSIVDNLPFACLETLACGKVVLASVQGGQREIITDGVNGFLFDHRDPGSFREKLMQVLQLPHEELLRIQHNARTSLSRYDYSVIAPRKIALLEEFRAGYRPPVEFPYAYPGCSRDAGASGGLSSSGDAGASGGLLSVVIPFYNLGAYLDEAVQSVLASTYQPLEVIIIDDGSTQRSSLAALDRWRNHPLVTVVHQPNEGLSAARNAGARIAGGSFLAFLDADDAVMPDYYEKAIAVLRRYDNVHFAGSWVQYFGAASGMWPAFNPSPPYLLAHNPVNGSALVYKTASFLAGGLNDPRLKFGLEDHESVVSMIEAGFGGIVLPEPLHRYRVRPGSMIRRLNRTKLLLAHGYIAEKHKDYYTRYATELVQLLNCNGPGYFYENPTLQLFVSAGTDKPGSWRNRLKHLARRNKRVKLVLLSIKKKTDRLWQKN